MTAFTVAVCCQVKNVLSSSTSEAETQQLIKVSQFLLSTHPVGTECVCSVRRNKGRRRYRVTGSDGF